LRVVHLVESWTDGKARPLSRFKDETLAVGVVPLEVTLVLYQCLHRVLQVAIGGRGDAQIEIGDDALRTTVRVVDGETADSEIPFALALELQFHMLLAAPGKQNPMMAKAIAGDRGIAITLRFRDRRTRSD
jgi:hypothetical protein